MKKTLSILLSLLMVLGTITCMFTVPVTTASAEEAATPTVEALPVTDFFSYTNAKTIKPETIYTVNKVEFPLSTNFGVRGWEGVARVGADGANYNALINADGNYVYPETEEFKTTDNKLMYKHDADGNYYDKNGNIVSDPYDSRISSKVLYQMTFDITVSEDVNSGVKVYPAFHSNDSVNWGFDTFVGMRNESGSAAAETAYNYGKIAKVADKHTKSITADKAATIVAGKTYSYTYLFELAPGADYINNIAITAYGLTQGSVTVSNPKIFPYSETDAVNFLRKEEIVYKKDAEGNYLTDEKGNKILDHYSAVVIPYAVEENGNVFIRMYGYRDIGSDSQVKRSVSAALGGKYYNMMIEGGSKYELSFDARYTSTRTFKDNDNDDGGRAPAFDFFETGALDYTDAYASIKNAEDTEFKFNKEGSCVSAQRSYNGPSNGYSYFYANSGSSTISRRIKNNIATLAYYDATGKEIGKETQGYGSQAGRNFKNGVNTSTWIKGVYSLDAIGAQTVLEAAQAEPTNAHHGNMRYYYADGKWEYNSARKNIYAEAEQDATVALAIDYIYAGSTYDFDNFTIKGSKVCDDVIEYKNKAGEVIELPASETPAVVTKDTVSGELTIKDYNSDAFTFEGWYVNGEFASANDTIAIAVGLTDTVKAVIVYENYAATQGSFENYTTSVILNKYESTTGGTKNYTVKTGEFVDGEWAIWDKWAKADAAETDDFLANYPYLTKTGGLNNSIKDFHVYSQYGAENAIAKEPEGDQYYTLNPYRGNAMLKVTSYSRQAVTKISGLQAGKTYTVSFVNWAPTQHDYVNTAFAVDKPMYLNQSERADYKEGDVVVVDNLGFTSISAPTAENVRTWRKITYNFVAKDSYAYLAFSVYNMDKYTAPCYIDDLVVVEYDCKGNHLYDDLEDASCNVCGEARVYPTSWDFEDGSMENIHNGTGTIKVVDAADQPAKIGSKYLEYTSNGWVGIAFNFPYEQGYKYTISYDFKIFTYGTGAIANGIDGVLLKYEDGVYGSKDQGAASLNPGSENIVTRYWEDGTAYEKVTGFSQAITNYFGRHKSKDGVYLNAMDTSYGPAAIWDGWQHFEIEVGSNNNHEGLVEYGIRPNDSGWVVGIDNFKVEKIALTTINEVDDATKGTTTFNIRARTADKKQGLRFKSTIDLDALNLSDGAKIVEYGTLAMKAELLTQGFILDRRAAKDKTPAGHVVAGVAYSEADGIDVRYALDKNTNTLTYTGVLTGIGVKNYDVDFAVRGYAIVELADGTRTTVYDAVRTISVYDAAQKIVAENKNADDVTIAQNVIKLYEAIQ